MEKEENKTTTKTSTTKKSTGTKKTTGAAKKTTGAKKTSSTKKTTTTKKPTPKKSEPIVETIVEEVKIEETNVVEPEVKVKDGDKVLVEGTDYTVEYTNNVAPGTATVTVKGIGNYKGLVEKTFTITSKYYYVTGVVRYNSGRVIKFAKITLTGTDYLGNSVTRTTKTDKHGKYTFNNLKKGTYVVTYRNESKEALLNEQN